VHCYLSPVHLINGLGNAAEDYLEFSMAEVDLWQWGNDQSHLEGVTNCKMFIHLFSVCSIVFKYCFPTFMQRGKNKSVISRIL